MSDTKLKLIRLQNRMAHLDARTHKENDNIKRKIQRKIDAITLDN